MRAGNRGSGGLRLGVLGGTFNPVHLGHLHIARSVQRLFSLSEVLFVVAAKPPHKPLDALIPLMHRYAMVSLATAGEASFVPSLVELEPQASSFSVDTMSKLARQVARANGILYFIAGGDSLLEVKSWRKSERLLTAFNFVFVVRPGTGTVDPGKTLPSKAVPRVCDLTGLGRAEMPDRGTGRGRKPDLYRECGSAGYFSFANPGPGGYGKAYPPSGPPACVRIYRQTTSIW